MGILSIIMFGVFHSSNLKCNSDGFVISRPIHNSDFLLLWEIFTEKVPSDQTWLIGNRDGNREYIPCFSLEDLRKERTFCDIEVYHLAYRILSGLKHLHDIGHYHGALHLRNIFWNPQTDHLYIVDPTLDAQIPQSIQRPDGWLTDIRTLGFSLATLQMTLQPNSFQDLDNLNLPLSYFVYKLTTDHSNIKNARKALNILDGILGNQRNLYEKIKESSTFQILRSLKQINEVSDFYRPYSVGSSESLISKPNIQFAGQREQIEESETVDSTIDEHYDKNDQQENLSPQYFHHLLPGVEKYIKWSKQQRKHLMLELSRRSLHTAEEIFLIHRGKEKSARQEGLAMWTDLLNHWSEYEKDNQLSNVSEERVVAEVIDFEKSQSIRADLLNFSWMMLRKSIGFAGYWRAPFTIVGQLCEMLLKGESGEDGDQNRLTINHYKETLKYQSRYSGVQSRIEGVQQTLKSSLRVVEIQKEINEFDQQSWFQKLKSSELAKEKKIRAQERLVLSNRNRLLKKWTPELKSILDAEVVVPMLREIEFEQKRIRDEFEKDWILPLRVPLTLDEKIEDRKNKDLQKVQITIGNQSLSFRWIPDDGLFGGIWVGTAPVTQGVYKKIMRENPARFINDNAPIEMISYWESIQFCRELGEHLSMPCGFIFSKADENSPTDNIGQDQEHHEVTTMIQNEQTQKITDNAGQEKIDEKKEDRREANEKMHNEKETSGVKKRRGRVSLFSSKKKEKKERIEVNEHTRITLSNKGFRLLSLDEWMYVARCNRKFIYSGSNFSHRVAWTRENSQQTQNVRRLYPNGWGLYDMSGNVDEWCWPDKRYFCDDIAKGLSQEQERICRQIDQDPKDFIRSCQQVQNGTKPRCGGSWYGDSTASSLLYEQVQWSDAQTYTDTIGFRIVYVGHDLPDLLSKK